MSNLQTLFSVLIRFETELWGAVDGRLSAEHNLALNRYLPMQVILRRRSCRVFDIADELAITIGGTSKLVDRIESAGDCLRRRNPDDRRSSMIELTTRGRESILRASETFEDELRFQLGPALVSVIEGTGRRLTSDDVLHGKQFAPSEGNGYMTVAMRVIALDQMNQGRPVPRKSARSRRSPLASAATYARQPAGSGLPRPRAG